MALKLGSPYHRAIRDVIFILRGYKKSAYLWEVLNFIKWGTKRGWGVTDCFSCHNPMWGRKTARRNLCAGCRNLAENAGILLDTWSRSTRSRNPKTGRLE